MPSTWRLRSLAVTRRRCRPLAAIGVTIQAGPEGRIGRGFSEDGGGELRGGLVLMNHFTAEITDPAVPYLLTMTIRALEGVLACESLTIIRWGEGPAVTSTSVRRPIVDSYLIRVRQELERHAQAGAPLLLKLVSEISAARPGPDANTPARELSP